MQLYIATHAPPKHGARPSNSKPDAPQLLQLSGPCDRLRCMQRGRYGHVGNTISKLSSVWPHLLSMPYHLWRSLRSRQATAWPVRIRALGSPIALHAKQFRGLRGNAENNVKDMMLLNEMGPLDSPIHPSRLNTPCIASLTEHISEALSTAHTTASN